ncbi:MAG: DMT family transporter [Candidatus Accumulibacter sp.]|jgi:drug/metabolite transporter (DMT)-like permease|nr:DMT family transporter [Accumulibacter sp.]
MSDRREEKMKFPPARFLASERERGIALVLITTVLFVIHDGISKYVARHYPVTEVLWVRYLVHVTFMLAVFGPRMRLNLVRARRPVLQIVRALLLVCSSFVFMNGLRYLPLGDSTAIYFLTPLLVTAFSAPLLGEKVEARNWLAVFLGFGGVLIIVRPGGGMLQAAAIFPFLSACCSSFYQIITRKFRGSENPVTTHFITGLTGVVVTGLTWQSSWAMPVLPHALLMIAQGFAAGVGHYLLIEVFQRMGPAVAAPFTYTQLVWAMLFGLAVFGEIPDAGSILGSLIIVASGIYLARFQRTGIRGQRFEKTVPEAEDRG